MPSRCALSISSCEGASATARLHDEPSQRLAQLVARVAQRDRQAFRTLYDLTSDRLFGVAIGLLHDRARAEEVLQDAYVRIWQRAAQFDAAVARPATARSTCCAPNARNARPRSPGPTSMASGSPRLRRHPSNSCSALSRPHTSTAACAPCRASSATRSRWCSTVA